MQELEKILEEIEQRESYLKDMQINSKKGGIDIDLAVGYRIDEIREIKDIIRKHMNDGKCGECSRRKWYQKGYEDGKNNNDGWIPVEKELPENAKHEGAFCNKYRVLTKYGETVGWYNPNSGGWYVLFWFMSERLLETEVDFIKGDIPKVLFCENNGFVIAWQPLPEAYCPEKEEEIHDNDELR